MTDETSSQTDPPASSQRRSQAGSQPSSAGFLDRRLRRSAEGKWVGGVCAGIERAYGIDAALLRVLLVLATLLGFGTGLVIYLVCWVVVPFEERTSGAGSPALAGPSEVAADAGSAPSGPANRGPANRGRANPDPASTGPAAGDPADDEPTSPISTGRAPAE